LLFPIFKSCLIFDPDLEYVQLESTQNGKRIEKSVKDRACRFRNIIDYVRLKNEDQIDIIGILLLAHERPVNPRKALESGTFEHLQVYTKGAE